MVDGSQSPVPAAAQQYSLPDAARERSGAETRPAMPAPPWAAEPPSARGSAVRPRQAVSAHRSAAPRPVAPVLPRQREVGPEPKPAMLSPPETAVPEELPSPQPPPDAAPESRASHPPAWTPSTDRSSKRTRWRMPPDVRLPLGFHHPGCSRGPSPPRLPQSNSSGSSFRSHQPPSAHPEWTCS